MIRRLFAIGQLVPVALSGQALDAARFRNPPADARPAMLWFWNGSITDSLIDRQLRDLRAAGFGAVVIVPAPNERLDPPFNSQPWFDNVEHALLEAERAGMRVWLSGAEDEYRRRFKQRFAALAGFWDRTTGRVVGNADWSVTPEQLRTEVGALVARGDGVSETPIALHGYWADPTDVQDPPSYDPSNPLSVALGDIVTWTARVTELARGRSAARMAILSQARDSAFTAIVTGLERLQASFDVISETALERAAEGPGELLIVGQSYHVVLVPPVRNLGPNAAHRLAVLSRGGGTVIAWRPLPATTGWPDTGPRFHVLDSLSQLRAALIRTPWSGVREPGPPALRIRALERGEDRVFLLYNESDRRIAIAPTFRMIGQPELWDPEEGSMHLAPTRWSPRLAVTDVPIELDPFQFVAIVFRGQSRSPRGPIGMPPIERTVAQAAPTWRFRFTTGDTLWRPTALGSWTTIDSTYSGTSVYEGTIDVPAALTRDERGWLDLGQVRDVAEVELNGDVLGRRLWRPYRLDVAQALRQGENHITVRVTNTLSNRNGKPLPSGLLGPVRLVVVRGAR